MVTLFFILTVCTHSTVYSWHQAWPVMPDGNLDAIPAWAWAQALGKKHNTTDVCPGSPNTADNNKGIIASHILDLNIKGQWNMPPGSVAARSGFPSIFETGICISAYPPPGENHDGTKRNEWALRFGGGDDGDAAKAAATNQLRDHLVGLQIPFMEVEGIYEGCTEISFIVSHQDGLTVTAFGEQLRQMFLQESYLYFGQRQQLNRYNLEAQCGVGNDPVLPPLAGPPSENYYREAGLGFAPDDTMRVGNICEFNAPDNEWERPFACTLGRVENGRVKMWGPTNVEALQHWLFSDC